MTTSTRIARARCEPRLIPSLARARRASPRRSLIDRMKMRFAQARELPKSAPDKESIRNSITWRS